MCLATGVRSILLSHCSIFSNSYLRTSSMHSCLEVTDPKFVSSVDYATALNQQLKHQSTATARLCEHTIECTHAEKGKQGDCERQKGEASRNKQHQLCSVSWATTSPRCMSQNSGQERGKGGMARGRREGERKVEIDGRMTVDTHAVCALTCRTTHPC